MPESIKMPVEEGMYVEIYGEVKYDTYEKCNVFELDLIEELDHDPYIRYDNYPGLKHIELHAHTNRSNMMGFLKLKKLSLRLSILAIKQ